ncbi:unnamed protein product [Didymodactylos carnosus]|uniref:PAS domain-containing protein n=1 Tax=Didymodactylos carnosus TaxID=1234261 RepID=A0A8S2GF41_9BILA|nr:unnamed protein product [Didymodactylos carnosus]CAF3506439.1 unnamed protein product [Didymodactylos carnosus]
MEEVRTAYGKTNLNSVISTLLPTSSSTTTTTVNTQLNTHRNEAIQQADVSSSRPALLAHDVLGPLLFEALDGFFFTINHNSEIDFVSDNVSQYLKFTQEELVGRSFYHCVHPGDVGEFDKAWRISEKCAGDEGNENNNENQSRGRTFLCRIRANDGTKDSNEQSSNNRSTTYVNMLVSVALHYDSSGSDRLCLACIARRPLEKFDKPAVLGLDQFSSRINLNFDIQCFDCSHMKGEKINQDFQGKNFKDYVHVNDVAHVIRHFQDVIENGEAKSPVYRFRLHDGAYAFVNTRSKLFSNQTATSTSDSILSTHTIIRLIENSNDLHGNASTRLMKSIISSTHELAKQTQQQKRIEQQQQQIQIQKRQQPIGTQFALTMLGVHQNTVTNLLSSSSNQQYLQHTLGNLIEVQNSLQQQRQELSMATTPTPLLNINEQKQSPNALSSPTTPQSQSSFSSLARVLGSRTLDSVSSTNSVEFGGKRMTRPSNDSSNIPSVHSPVTFDLLLKTSLSTTATSTSIFASPSPSNITSSLNSSLSCPSPSTLTSTSSPLTIPTNDSYLHTTDVYTSTTTSTSNHSTMPISCSSGQRHSMRLRQLLGERNIPSSPNSTNSVPSSPQSSTIHYHKSPSNNITPSSCSGKQNITIDELLQAESPTTTTQTSPQETLSAGTKRRRYHSGNIFSSLNNSDALLKQILAKKSTTVTTTPSTLTNTSSQLNINNESSSSSPASTTSSISGAKVSQTIKTEPNANDDNITGSKPIRKDRNDVFLRTLLNDEVRPQKVVVEAPFVYGSRYKANSNGNGHGNGKGLTIFSLSCPNLRSQTSVCHLDENAVSMNKNQRRNPQTHDHHQRAVVASPTSNSTIKKEPRLDDNNSSLSDIQDIVSTTTNEAPDSVISDTLASPSLESLLSDSFQHDSHQSISQKQRTSLKQPLKRSLEHEDAASGRKQQKLLPQLLTDDKQVVIKTEYKEQQQQQQHPDKTTLARNKSEHLATESDRYDYDNINTQLSTSARGQSSTTNSSSNILRSLIKTPHTPAGTSATISKKDEPLYELLQNLEAPDLCFLQTLPLTASSSTSNSNQNTIITTTMNNNNNNSESLFHYTPSVTTTRTATTTSNDDCLALLLSTSHNQNDFNFLQKTSISKQSMNNNNNNNTNNYSQQNKINSIMNDLFPVITTTTTITSTTTTTANNNNNNNITSSSNNEFSSLFDNNDFLECLNDSTAIDFLLQNSSSVLDADPLLLSSVSNTNSDLITIKDVNEQKAINEIAKSLIDTTFPMPNFGALTGDPSFSNEMPRNRIAPSASSRNGLEEMQTKFRPQQQQQQQSFSTQLPPSTGTYQYPQMNNTFLVDDGLSLDSGSVPNISLSPLSNTFLPSQQPQQHLNRQTSIDGIIGGYPNISMRPSHVQHHHQQQQQQLPSQTNPFYHHNPNRTSHISYSSSVPYNNIPSQFLPPNQVVGPNMMFQQTPSNNSQQRSSQTQNNFMAHQTFMQQQQHQQQQSQMQMDQQQQQWNNPQHNVQLHMSMNVVLPNIGSKSNSACVYDRSSRGNQQRMPSVTPTGLNNSFNSNDPMSNMSPQLPGLSVGTPDFVHIPHSRGSPSTSQSSSTIQIQQQQTSNTFSNPLDALNMLNHDETFLNQNNSLSQSQQSQIHQV